MWASLPDVRALNPEPSTLDPTSAPQRHLSVPATPSDRVKQPSFHVHHLVPHFPGGRWPKDPPFVIVRVILAASLFEISVVPNTPGRVGRGPGLLPGINLSQSVMGIEAKLNDRRSFLAKGKAGPAPRGCVDVSQREGGGPLGVGVVLRPLIYGKAVADRCKR